MACQHFFGKTLDDAERLLQDSSVIDDFVWMGPVAFRFYVQAAVRYVQSDASDGDCEGVMFLLVALEFRLENEPHEVRPVALQLAALCRYVAEHRQKFDADDNTTSRYLTLQQKLLSLSTATESNTPTGISAQHIESFREFWPFYVGEHRRRSTRVWHFMGTTMALSLLPASIVMRWWWGLLAVPVCGYAFAWISHFFVERNRPATFRYPLWSLAADFKMWWLMVRGRMAGEVERVLGEKRR